MVVELERRPGRSLCRSLGQICV